MGEDRNGREQRADRTDKDAYKDPPPGGKHAEACYFHFPNQYENSRCVEYIKLDPQNRKLEVLLNCSGEAVKTEPGGEILFARNYHDNILEPKGTLIRKKG